jgi:hypothetical protein
MVSTLRHHHFPRHTCIEAGVHSSHLHEIITVLSVSAQSEKSCADIIWAPNQIILAPHVLELSDMTPMPAPIILNFGALASPSLGLPRPIIQCACCHSTITVHAAWTIYAPTFVCIDPNLCIPLSQSGVHGFV